MNEFELIKKYFNKLVKNNPSAKELNDDIFFNKKKKLAVSIDTYNEGVHFPNFKNPDLVIKKVLRSSISDLISKGVKPKYIFISASGNKKSFSKNNLKKISKSMNYEQKKYQVMLSGGDTTNLNKVSFSVSTIGFANKIVERNKAKNNDDIYVTGNIGDSYLGLQIIKNKIKFDSKINNYFINQYYCPQIPFDIFNFIKKIASTSMDISDGLLSDLIRLINKQNLKFEIYVEKVPISKKLKFFFQKYCKKKQDYIFHGDDYQIIFTSPKKNRKLIKNISIKMNHKITLIGKINNKFKKNSLLLDNKTLNMSNFKGYFHKF